jgi:hypothetical protein
VSEEAVVRKSAWRRTQIAIAFLLPAIIGGFVGSLILSLTALSDMITPPDVETEFIRVTHTGLVFMGTALGATWGQLATLIVGLPAHVWLTLYTTRRAWMYGVAGAAAGTIFGVLFVWPTLFGSALPSLEDLMWLAFASIGGGAAAGFGFWLIRRPDRDAASVVR